MRLKLILQLKIYSCASLLIYKMKFIFCLAYWNFFEKCYLVVWCDGVWCGGMVRPPRLVSYAFLYTTNTCEVFCFFQILVNPFLSFNSKSSNYFDKKPGFYNKWAPSSRRKAIF